jgi:hypothetical protein
VREVETAVTVEEEFNSNNSSRRTRSSIAAAAAATAADSAICSTALSRSDGVAVCHERPLGQVDAATYSVQCSEQSESCDSSSTGVKSNSPARPCGGLLNASSQLPVRQNTVGQALIGTQLSGKCR